MIRGFPERLKRVREQRGLTYKEVAEKAGVDRSSVSRYEKGEQSPRLEVLFKLAAIYGVSVDFLLNGETGKRYIDVSALTMEEEGYVREIVKEILKKRS